MIIYSSGPVPYSFYDTCNIKSMFLFKCIIVFLNFNAWRVLCLGNVYTNFYLNILFKYSLVLERALAYKL